MTVSADPRPVRLLVGLLTSLPEELSVARSSLTERFGPVSDEYGPVPFTATSYYDSELGTPILRQFLAFSNLVSPDRLAAIKLLTNSLEQQRAKELGRAEQRPINLDPGLLDATHLILASTKAGGHRIYLGQGIYAEVTLLFLRGKWEGFAWSYPDFSGGDYFPFLDRLRRDYLRGLKAQEL